MKISLIVAHPNTSSFNFAVAETVRRKLEQIGHQVYFHDLYREKFDPLIRYEEIPADGQVAPEILEYCRELADSDGIVIVHPNWWGQPPAILKGWVDRVLRPGIAYEFEEGDGGEGVPSGLLKAHTAIVLNTSNTSPEREDKVFGDPLELIWKECIFDFCGVKSFYRKMFRVVVTSGESERVQWLKETDEIIEKYFGVENGL
ncbi:MAG: NAD(P)H dehydrogenase [Spirochaetes bacterium GWF1_51_8]|nr:MAG: NAD(P)H dehydrogenase [Spirochaetes bacterium GWF1_51_8]